MQNETGEFRDVIEKLKREGFVRVRVDGEIMELGQPEPIRLKKTGKHTIEAVVDRLVIRDGIRTRLADSVETALKWGGNRHRRVAAEDGADVERRTGEVGVDTLLDQLRQSRDELLVRRTDARSIFPSIAISAPARLATGWAPSWCRMLN